MFIKKLLILLIIFISIFAFSSTVLAEESGGGVLSSGVQSFGSSVFGGEPQSPAQIAALIIKTLLTLMGMLFIVLIIYGGFTWMTSSGEVEKVKKAKAIIVQATIGLAIILLSYAIASFVINALTSASSGIAYPAGS